MTTTMRLAVQKVGRSLGTYSPPKRSPTSLIEQRAGPAAAAVNRRWQRGFWRVILNGRTLKFIPFFATRSGRYII